MILRLYNWKLANRTDSIYIRNFQSSLFVLLAVSLSAILSIVFIKIIDKYSHSIYKGLDGLHQGDTATGTWVAHKQVLHHQVQVCIGLQTAREKVGI